MSELHAENGIEAGERTACGLVLLEGEQEGIVLLAAPGSVVTCQHCKMIQPALLRRFPDYDAAIREVERLLVRNQALSQKLLATRNSRDALKARLAAMEGIA